MFNNLLNMSMVLLKGFTFHQQLWSYRDWASVKSLIQKTGEVLDRIHNPWFTMIVALPLRHGASEYANVIVI